MRTKAIVVDISLPSACRANWAGDQLVLVQLFLAVRGHLALARVAHAAVFFSIGSSANAHPGAPEPHI
jgi:hypothetical protein